MRCSLLAPLMLVLASGCAEEELHPVSASRPPVWSDSYAVAPPPAAPEPAAARPRLSQTVTLGQDDYSPNAPRPAPQQSANGTNVTVNNNIIVQSPPAIYGGYGGYGSYGYGGTRTGDGRTGVSNAPRAAWAPSGWEGAGRTAAPGRTPGVGGNWAPPPSTGPATMK